MEDKLLVSGNAITPENVDQLDESYFKTVQEGEALHDEAFQTKRVSYLRDSLRRFAKNKGSVVAAIIILIIVLYALIVPLTSPRTYVDPIKYPSGYRDANFAYVLPYNPMFAGTGFWDGTKVEDGIAQDTFDIRSYDDSNHSPIVEVVGKEEKTIKIGPKTTTIVSYSVRTDTYALGCKRLSLSKVEFDKLMEYENAQKKLDPNYKTIMKPLVDVEGYLAEYEQTMRDDGVGENQIVTILDFLKSDYNLNPRWYFAMTAKTASGSYSSNQFLPVLDANNNPIDIYLRDDSGNPVYYELRNGTYNVRVDYLDYARFSLGFDPHFLFGANASGQDIFLRLASGARFSLLLGVAISAINFIIGLIWGAVSGYYGGAVDMAMERVTDIIANVPSIIILSICSIQFTNNIELKASIGQGGIVLLAFLVAFVYSGWVGVAGTTRMQFYRFKGQEYVLASRTLGAKDRRLIFRHILPNAIGTLVTSSVLMIPGVIFSESSLSYLGIIDFSTSGMSSIGTLLNEGQSAGLQYNPHVLLFPCIIISLLMICFNLFGNGLRDAFNTTLKGAEE
ncbi:MAG: ABC transporter permease [Bacilli bacterium]|nr:ABC transporter permease [Bacilli bacterium]